MTIGERYGFTQKESNNLNGLWNRVKKNCTWSNYEEFVAWVATVKYEKWMRIHRLDKAEPHGPDNSYFEKPTGKKRDKVQRMGYCANCKRAACESRGNGCKRWRVWFVQNWNRNISTNPSLKAPEPEPTHWVYEHPDRVRELMGNG